ncbi:uncharacterized protein LOC110188204 [Drosophila serrata]|uniref:uncharacterized protein LOC110188204 n=1 Tax=Drosophila serrata TaxID=7274 RepID=UPI000A1D1D82|nr:uncharacterized protein LOC110188204 [Drosophila serrata]
MQILCTNELEEHKLKAQPSLPVAKKRPGGSRKLNYDHLDVCFTKSNRGNNLLTIDGKPFTLNRRIRDVCYWECVKLRCKYTKCSARVVTKSDQISALRGYHNHP